MPTQGEIPGFTNCWYPLAVESARLQVLPSGRSIQMIAAPLFLATKLEAFHGRGQGASLFRHDLEQCRLSPPVLWKEPAAPFNGLLATSTSIESPPASLPADEASQQRLPDLRQTLAAITALAEP